MENQDIELEEISEDLIFSQANSNDYPETRRKLLKTYVLTYIRQHYIKIFYILVAIILLLFIYIITIHATRENGKLSNQYQINASADIAISNNNTEHTQFRKIACSRINCKTVKSPCRPQSNSYRAVREYSCCNCLPQHMILKWFASSLRRDRIELVIEDTAIDMKNLSKHDLTQLSQLPCFSGSWDVLQISDSVSYLAYSVVDLTCTTPPQSARQTP